MEKYVKPSEQNQEKKGKQKVKLHWTAECFLALAVYIALFYAVRYVMAAALLLAVPCVYIGVRRGWVAGGAFYGLCGAATYLLHTQMALVASALNLLPCIVCCYVIRSKQKPWVSICAACTATLLSAGVAVWILHAVADGNVAKYLADNILTKAAADPTVAMTVFSTLVSNDLATGMITAEQALTLLYTADPLNYIMADSSVTLLKQMIEAAIPELLVNYIAYGGLAGFYIPWLLAKYFEQDVAKLPPVETWVMPKQHGYYMAATCALGYLCMVFGSDGLYAPAQMLFSLTVIAFCIVGASVITFFLTVRIKARAGRVAIAAGIYLLIPGLAAAIGIIEQLFGIRKRIVIIKQPKGGDK